MLERIKNYPTLPAKFDGFDNVYSYLKDLSKTMLEESTERLSDFSFINLANLPVFDVRLYGATGDGATNDTVAFQDAITAAAVVGGIVFCPPGTYLVSHLHMLSKVILMGSGWATVIKHLASSTDHLFVLDSVNVYGTGLVNFQIDGNKANQSNSIDGIHYDNTAGSFTYPDPAHRFEHLWISNVKQDGMYLSAACKVTYGADIYVLDAGRYSYNFLCNDSNFYGLISGHSVSHGFYVSCDNTSFHGCKGYGAGIDVAGDVDGWYIYGANMRFLGCEGQENTRHGMNFYGSGSNVVAGGKTGENDHDGISINNGSSYNMITAHKSQDNTDHAVYIDATCHYNYVQVVTTDTVENNGTDNSIDVLNLQNDHTHVKADLTDLYLDGSASWNPGSLAAGNQETKAITVSGAAIGDFVSASCSVDLRDFTLTGYVQAANTVEIVLANIGASTYDFNEQTFYVKVWKRA